MTFPLHLFTGCFDCTSVMVPHVKLPKFRSGSKKSCRNSNRKSRRDTPITEPHKVANAYMTSYLSGNSTGSTDSMATASTFDSTILESPSSSCYTSNNNRSESPATVCFLPQGIDKVHKVKLYSRDMPSPVESFYFLPLQDGFADLKETTDKADWGYFIDFD